MSRFFVACALLLAGLGSAQACMFVRDIPPEAWYQWSSSLFAGEVTRVEEDAGKALDTIDVRVIEVFKGPAADQAGQASATLTMPVRLRKLCRLELPKAGERILVALNERNDASWVPLTDAYSERMRKEKKKP